MDWRHLRELLDAAAKPYRELKNLCVWAKTNAGTGELDPYCVDTIIKRFEAVWGVKATHAGSNLDFAGLSRRRLEEKYDGRKSKAKKAQGR
jgi:hypothetical protein